MHNIVVIKINRNLVRLYYTTIVSKLIVVER